MCCVLQANSQVAFDQNTIGLHLFQNDYESVMTLKIDRVDDQHFRTYYFEAENKLGKVIHEVTLSQGEFAAIQIALLCPLLFHIWFFSVFSAKKGRLELRYNCKVVDEACCLHKHLSQVK